MNIKQRIEEEDKWQFNHFDHDDALEIGLSIIESVKQKKLKGVSIQIVYDDLIVFHHLMTGRKESPWLQRKVKTVMDSKHSSLYVYYASHENNEYSEWQTNPDYAISGGGFPIIEQGIVRGAICVSGLEHLEDHKLIIEALKAVLA